MTKSRRDFAALAADGSDVRETNIARMHQKRCAGLVRPKFVLIGSEGFPRRSIPFDLRRLPSR